MLGAVANKRPDLFQAMILQVPFVDVSTTMLDATLPLTMHEYDEWGNPSADPAVRDYLRGYSPCDNIVGLSEEAPAAYPYPHMYVTAATNDTRVGYWEPAKWVSRLQTVRQRAIEHGGPAVARAAANRMLLLHTDEQAGHFGSSLEETAREYAFLHKALGLPAAAAEDETVWHI